MPPFPQSDEPCFAISEGAYVSVPTRQMLGPIQHLGRTGLRFQHFGAAEPHRFHARMDIFTISGIFIRNIPFEMVSSASLGECTFFSAEQNRLYSIRFGDLSREHIRKIEGVIQQYAVTDRADVPIA